MNYFSEFPTLQDALMTLQFLTLHIFSTVEKVRMCTQSDGGHFEHLLK
jgi:hypothetical protein